MNTRGPINAVLLGAALLTGCTSAPFASPRSELAVESQSHEGRRMSGDFDRGVYSFDDRDAMIMVLLTGPPESPTQAAVVRMFWRPRAGATPISSSATNATVQYIVFAPDAEGGDEAGEVGVYSGAGFLYPNTRPGGGTLSAGLWQASLRLADRSSGFNDLLGKAILRGELSARRDDAEVEELLRRLNTMVSNRLGYPRLVEAGEMEHTAPIPKHQHPLPSPRGEKAG